MRKLIYAINLTLDGCFGHLDGAPPDDADGALHDYYTHLVGDAGLLVYGRKTYELMVPYWPDVANNPAESKADRAFGQTFVSKQKVVFSRSLKSAGADTRIIRTNLRDEVLQLKQEPGGDILLGGVDVASQLIELGLVDEYRFVVQPIIAGKGRRLLEGVSLQEKLKLKLIESKIFKSGSVALHYVKR